MTENSDVDRLNRNDSSPIYTRTGDEKRSGRHYTDTCPPCDACNTTHHDGLHTVYLANNEYSVCDGCLDLLVDKIEQYYWWDQLTEAQYNRAAEYLRSLDEVWCVKADAYAGGEMWVHTPFCDAAVVNDVCEHFGFQIRWFSAIQPGKHEFDCVHKHGPCIEISLDYNNRINTPLPLEYDISKDVAYHDVKWLEDHHKLFLHGD